MTDEPDAPDISAEPGGLDGIAAGAWLRLRNLIAALDRVDRLETSTEFDGWLREFAQDEGARAVTIREFLLRVLRQAADPLNFQILEYLHTQGAVSAGALLETLKLSRVELIERLNGLSRAGLTVQALEGEQVEATSLAVGLLALLNDLAARMEALAENDYLLNPKAPLPKFSKEPLARR